jgi:hypothetical protein
MRMPRQYRWQAPDDEDHCTRSSNRKRDQEQPGPATIADETRSRHLCTRRPTRQCGRAPAMSCASARWVLCRLRVIQHMRCSNMRSGMRADGSVEEIPTEHCPAGHPLLPRGTLVGWSPCDCTPGVHGHGTYRCRFLVDGRECGLVLNFPPCRDPSAGPSSWVWAFPHGQPDPYPPHPRKRQDLSPGHACKAPRRFQEGFERLLVYCFAQRPDEE